MTTAYLRFTTVYTGTAREIKFPLHEHTVNVGHVGAILEALLERISEQVQERPPVSDGDLLQAMCMALAIRMNMVEAPADAVSALVATALEQANEAVKESVVGMASRA